MTFAERMLTIDRRIIFLVIGVCTLLPLLYPVGLPIKISSEVRGVYDHIESLPEHSVFLLSIDAATQIERLASAGDRDPSLWQPIIDGRPVFEDEMQAVGATVLDGRMTTSELASLIVQAVRP